MQKTLWIMLALVVAGGAPVAHADSFAPLFSPSGVVDCPTCGIAGTPTAPDVTFPSPTLSITDQGIGFSVMLPPSSLPGDSYSWSTSIAGFFGSEATMTIVDTTRNTSVSDTVGLCFCTFENEFGSLKFTPVTAPEPSSLALIPLGLGALLIMRKRIGQRLPQAS
jgi:hypothetical protein